MFVASQLQHLRLLQQTVDTHLTNLFVGPIFPIFHYLCGLHKITFYEAKSSIAFIYITKSQFTFIYTNIYNIQIDYRKKNQTHLQDFWGVQQYSWSFLLHLRYSLLTSC